MSESYFFCWRIVNYYEIRLACACMEHSIPINICSLSNTTRSWFPREIIPMTAQEYQEALQSHGAHDSGCSTKNGSAAF